MPETLPYPAASQKIRLFLVDDHALFREGLLRLLSTGDEFEPVGATGDIDEALREITASAPDVVILDYDLGERTAVDVVRSLKERKFGGRILLVTAGLPDRDALTLIRSGVAGIFHKHHAPEELQRCIREVAQGRTLFEQDYLRELIESATDQPDESAPQLTQRDREILHFLLEGLANKEIASQLRISESAVKASLQSLFAKTGVRTRSQLVRIALEKYADQLNG
jgi:two-component system nitrate/nitrite response regulator NarL